MKSKSPKQLKDLLKQIKPPKGVRRKNDEGDELLDCEGEEMTLNMPDADEEVSDDNEDHTEDVDPAPEDPAPAPKRKDSNSTEPQHESQATVQLTPLYENEELRKDAQFIDEVGELLRKGETSNRLAPYVMDTKR